MDHSPETNDYGRTAPKYLLMTVVECPKDVAASGLLYLLGHEWGPDNKFLAPIHKGWAYHVAEADKAGQRPPTSRLRFTVSESEIVAWEKDKTL